jgi:hypothetical protein
MAHQARDSTLVVCRFASVCFRLFNGGYCTQFEADKLAQVCHFRFSIRNIDHERRDIRTTIVVTVSLVVTVTTVFERSKSRHDSPPTRCRSSHTSICTRCKWRQPFRYRLLSFVVVRCLLSMLICSLSLSLSFCVSFLKIKCRARESRSAAANANQGLAHLRLCLVAHVFILN